MWESALTVFGFSAASEFTGSPLSRVFTNMRPPSTNKKTTAKVTLVF